MVGIVTWSHPQKHLKKEYHKKAASTTAYAISAMAVIYIIMGVLLVMLFAQESRDSAVA